MYRANQPKVPNIQVNTTGIVDSSGAFRPQNRPTMKWILHALILSSEATCLGESLSKDEGVARPTLVVPFGKLRISSQLTMSGLVTPDAFSRTMTRANSADCSRTDWKKLLAQPNGRLVSATNHRCPTPSGSTACVNNGCRKGFDGLPSTYKAAAHQMARTYRVLKAIQKESFSTSFRVPRYSRQETIT